MNAEIKRLAAAIATISQKYLVNVTKAGDVAAIQKWSLRLADYSTRLALLTAPTVTALTPDEDAIVAGHDHVLTYDEETVIFLDAEDKVLIAQGKPAGRDGAERGSLPLYTHIQMAEDLGLPLHAAEFKSLIVPGTAQ